MYDGEFGPAARALLSAAQGVLDTGDDAATHHLREMAIRHLHVIQGFNKLHIGSEPMRDRLIDCCECLRDGNDEDLRDIAGRIRESAQWFGDLY